jgi:REP element-mobilizing transposase RayT
MPREPRIHYPGAVYHVISRGNNRQEIFNSVIDYKRFLTILKTVKGKVPFLLYAYCLMPNHIHFLLQVEEHPLSNIMQRLLTAYALRFNKTYKRQGHLFQGRYHTILCNKDSYLLELVRYIHLNPVRAGLVKNPTDWKWSGHNGYVGRYDDALLEATSVLSQIGRTSQTARSNYLQFLKDGLNRCQT